MKRSDIVSKISETIHEVDPIAMTILYGSEARAMRIQTVISISLDTHAFG